MRSLIFLKRTSKLAEETGEEYFFSSEQFEIIKKENR